MSDWTLHTGDCLSVLPTLEAESVDSVITDCPYGLKFMGQEWDHGVPGRPFWEACLRVAKSGAYLLAFGGTRTWHRLACAVEDAGWELKDTLCWLYGSGFPKGVDVGKAVDRAAGAVREVGSHRARPDGTTRPNRENWSGMNGTVYAQDEWTQTQGGRMGGRESTPATDAARLWDGWHSTLKPGWEPILVAMKPLDGTYAHNALTHGVAGLNVDGTRIPTPDCYNCAPASSGYSGMSGYVRGTGRQSADRGGRYPANVVLDEEAARLLDEQAGERGRLGPDHVSKTALGRMNDDAWLPRPTPALGYHDSGGPSRFFATFPASPPRFFYCAKASRRERGEGNTHATVKPLALMRWLCRLTKTPTGGVVLDPFAGSGTTLLAALLEGRRAIGIEKDPGYAEAARKRLAGAQGPLFAHAGGEA